MTQAIKRNVKSKGLNFKNIYDALNYANIQFTKLSKTAVGAELELIQKQIALLKEMSDFIYGAKFLTKPIAIERYKVYLEVKRDIKKFISVYNSRFPETLLNEKSAKVAVSEYNKRLQQYITIPMVKLLIDGFVSTVQNLFHYNIGELKTADLFVGDILTNGKPTNVYNLEQCKNEIEYMLFYSVMYQTNYLGSLDADKLNFLVSLLNSNTVYTNDLQIKEKLVRVFTDPAVDLNKIISNDATIGLF